MNRLTRARDVMPQYAIYLNKGLLLGTLGVAAFALTLPFTRIAVLDSSPFDVFAVRLLIASVAAWVVLLCARVSVLPRKHWREMMLVIVGVVIGFPLFTSIAMQSQASAHGGVMLGILPLATAMAGSILNRERPSIGFWLTAAAGSALVIVFALLGSQGALTVADISLILAVACAALGYACGARLSQQLPPWQVISWALAIALPLALLQALFVNWQVFTVKSSGQDVLPVWWALLYLGLISQYGGFLLWYRALALDGVARTSQIQLIQPFMTLLAAAALLGEQINWLTILFAVLILATVVLSRRTRICTAAVLAEAEKPA